MRANTLSKAPKLLSISALIFLLSSAAQAQIDGLIAPVAGPVGDAQRSFSSFTTPFVVQGTTLALPLAALGTATVLPLAGDLQDLSQVDNALLTLALDGAAGQNPDAVIAGANELAAAGAAYLANADQSDVDAAVSAVTTAINTASALMPGALPSGVPAVPGGIPSL